MTRHVRTLAFATLIAILAAGCDATGPDDAREEEFTDILLGAGNASTSAEVGDVVLEEEEEQPEDVGDGNSMICTRTRVSAMRAGGGPPGYPLFDPAAGVIYPGALLQGATLSQAPPDPIAVQRAGGVVSINIVNGSQGVYRQVDEVTQARITQAMNDIINDNIGVLPSNFSISVHDARTRQQFALALGVDFNNAFASVEANFSMRTDREYSRFLVRLTQSFYTMSFQLPTSSADLFAPSVTPADLARQIGPGNPATYIADVTYGRIYYMLVESTATQLELRAALDASFRGGFGEGGVNVELESLQQTNELSVSLFALGGEAGATIRTFGQTDLGQLADLFAESSDIRTGVPLSYVVRNVVDNRIVSTQLATEYDLVDCRIYSNMLAARSFRFDAGDGLVHEPFTLTNGETARYLDRWTEQTSGAASVDEDHTRMFNWVTECLGSGIQTEKVQDVFAGRVYADGPNGDSYVRFLQHRTPGLDTVAHPFAASDTVIHVLPWLRFDGRDLAESDFTIFAVARSTATADNLRSSGGQYFLFTNQRDQFHTQGHTVILGWNGEGRAEMAFRGQGAVQIPTTDRQSWAVYAYRFSQIEGLSIFVNTAANRADNTNMKTPLKQFIGASLGVLQQRHFTRINYSNLPEDRCWNYGYAGPGSVGIDLAFLEAYTVSASEVQIGERMMELGDRFGIF